MDGIGQVFDGLPVAALGLVGQGPAVVGRGALGVELDRLVVVLEGLLVLLLVVVGVATVVVGGHVLGIQLEGAAVLGDGPLVPAPEPGDFPADEVSLGAIGV